VSQIEWWHSTLAEFVKFVASFRRRISRLLQVNLLIKGKRRR